MAVILFQAYLLDEEGDRHREAFFMSTESAHKYLSETIQEYGQGYEVVPPLSEWVRVGGGYTLSKLPYPGWLCRIRTIEAEP